MRASLPTLGLDMIREQLEMSPPGEVYNICNREECPAARAASRLSRRPHTMLGFREFETGDYFGRVDGRWAAATEHIGGMYRRRRPDGTRVSFYDRGLFAAADLLRLVRDLENGVDPIVAADGLMESTNREPATVPG